MEIKTYKEAINVLKPAGRKVAIQSKVDGHFIFCQKTDFIETLRKLLVNTSQRGFTDYDGNVEPATMKSGVLHIHAGSF